MNFLYRWLGLLCCFIFFLQAWLEGLSTSGSKLYLSWPPGSLAYLRASSDACLLPSWLASGCLLWCTCVACLLACWLACLLACWFACWRACLLAGLLACLLPCLLRFCLVAGLFACLLAWLLAAERVQNPQREGKQYPLKINYTMISQSKQNQSPLLRSGSIIFRKSERLVPCWPKFDLQRLEWKRVS